LYVAVDFFPDASKAQVDWTKTPPVLPTVPGGLQELEQTVANIAKKIDKMPLEQIGTDLHQTLRSLDGTLHTINAMVKRVDTDITPMARQALTESQQMFKTTEQALAADAPLQQDLREALRGLSRASQSLRQLGDYLERHPEAILRGKKRDER
jgi:paraquat-inducible protein B